MSVATFNFSDAAVMMGGSPDSFTGDSYAAGCNLEFAFSFTGTKLRAKFVRNEPVNCYVDGVLQSVSADWASVSGMTFVQLWTGSEGTHTVRLKWTGNNSNGPIFQNANGIEITGAAPAISRTDLYTPQQLLNVAAESAWVRLDPIGWTRTNASGYVNILAPVDSDVIVSYAFRARCSLLVFWGHQGARVRLAVDDGTYGEATIVTTRLGGGTELFGWQVVATDLDDTQEHTYRIYAEWSFNAHWSVMASRAGVATTGINTSSRPDLVAPVAFYGDSITAGGSGGEEKMDGFPAMVACAMGRPCLKLGVSGSTIIDHRVYDPNETDPPISTRSGEARTAEVTASGWNVEPYAVIETYGTNDTAGGTGVLSQFQASAQAMYESLLADSTTMLVCVRPIFKKTPLSEANRRAFNAAKVAAVAAVDNPRLIYLPTDAVALDPTLGVDTADGTHLNAVGHAKAGKAIVVDRWRMYAAGSVALLTAEAVSQIADALSDSDVAVQAAAILMRIGSPDVSLTADVGAVKAKTDNLPAMPASQGDVTAVASALTTVGTAVTAVKAKTDNLPADPASNTQVNTRATPADVPSAAAIAAAAATAAAAAILVTPAQKIATDSSNRVTTSNPAAAPVSLTVEQTEVRTS